MNADVETQAIDAIRVLAMDAVQQAGDGHPGTAMALAPLGYLLWTRYRRHNPSDPRWFGRDRFVLSCGHAAILQYSLLYLTGYDLSLDDLKHLRQWGSRTPGHPEVGLTPGVEATTGPLSEGLGQAVGMAMAQRYLSRRFDRPGHTLFDHRIYVICSDGDLMEGLSHEAASLAGHLKLGQLVCFYDDNHITIEGDTALAYSDDVPKRFEAYHWHVQTVPDVNDLAALSRAIEAAQADPRPSMICLRTHIAFPAPDAQDKASSHGAPLGKEEIAKTKDVLGWPQEPFFVPRAALDRTREVMARGKAQQAEWEAKLAAFKQAFPKEAAELDRCLSGKLPEGWETGLPTFESGTQVATRAAGGKVLAALYQRIPNLIGGSGDLGPSTETLAKELPAFNDAEGVPRNVHYGIREHAAGAASLGMALHGGVVPFCATFLTFSDFMRPAMRLACISEAPVRYVFTHDSIGLGGDGPTHQPVEQLASLRAMPGLTVIRPADANETREAWIAALRCPGPAMLVLTRQKVPVLGGSGIASAEGVHRGAYVLAEAEGGTPEVLLIASGSEVHLALEARELLARKVVRARVVSMPSWELFEAQSETYRHQVLPPEIRARVAVEAASPFGWERYVGELGATVAVPHYGASAPGDVVMEQFGFTALNVANHAEATLNRVRKADRVLVGARSPGGEHALTESPESSGPAGIGQPGSNRGTGR